MDEKAWIAALRKGEEPAFRKLVEQFQDKVYNTAWGYLRNDIDAEDIAQEVFIEVYRSIGKFKEKSSLSTWIYRITVTKALELIRSRKRLKRSGNVVSLSGNTTEDRPMDIPDHHHPGIVLENQEKANVLFAAIDQLAETQKTAFTLHKVEGLSYQEVAEIMETTLPAVESLMHRAKQNLKKKLTSYYQSLKS